MDGFNQFPDGPFGQAADGGKAISCGTSIFHQFPTQGNQPEGIVEGKRTGGHRCGKSADRQSGNEVRHAFLADQPVGAGHSRDQNAELCYAKNLAGFYGKQYKILAGTAAAMLLISAIVGALLYQAMKRIYRPVSNISHELKTPLTSVMGYAQYLSQTSRLSEADRKFAQQQI